ncbi:hypothetical protein [Rathayibacter sp. AY1B5]|uniref:hypothetical protein n=1 Tax=Rathayibacter sp. AY1B5 TaxID=2080530 RepID=UPI0011B03D00|nr:hypothetical protein [Rathayibacter sp. AY1B5]
MERWLNDEMRLSVPSTVTAVDDDPALRPLIERGFARSGDSVVLRAYAVSRLRTAPPSDAWGVESWVNSIHLRSNLPAANVSWREQVVAQGLFLIDGLLPRMVRLSSGRAVQAVLSLQSSPISVDPEADFASGSVHFTLVRSAVDDARAVQTRWMQPVMVVTLDSIDTSTSDSDAS